MMPARSIELVWRLRSRDSRGGRAPLAGLWLFLGLVAGMAEPVRADPLCAAATFPETEDVHLAVAGTKTQMHSGIGNCNQDPRACAETVMLGVGDKLVTAHQKDGWLCAARIAGDTVKVGWIRIADARLQADVMPDKPVDWIGNWVLAGGDGQIALGQRGTRLSAEATVTFDMSGPDDAGDIRAGNFEGTFAPRAGWSEAIGGCQVHLLRLGPYLIAKGQASGADGNDCGGDGVTFNGIYLRR
jgi:hypothetical protein